MLISRPSISSIYDSINTKEFLIKMMIMWPCVITTIEGVDKIMKEFAHKLEGEQRLEFEDNCLERIDELLQEEKDREEFHRTYNYEMHSVMNAGCDLANFKSNVNHE